MSAIVPGLEGAAIICLANSTWEGASRLNCHHIMSRLAPANRVLFVETIGGRRPALNSSRDLKKVAQRLRHFAAGARAARPNLFVLSPFALPGFSGAGAGRLNRRLLEAQIRPVARRLFAKNQTRIVWVFSPAYGELTWQLPSDLLIYQCIDEHAAYPGAPAQATLRMEGELIRRADIVLTSSQTLFEDRRKLRPDVVCLPNVADAPLFMQALRDDTLVPAEIGRLPKPVAGFVGNVSSYKVDLELMAGLAQRNRDWTFVLIGEVGIGESQTDLGRLREQPNIVFTGPRPYAQLPAYVKGFDVCLIPFRLTELTRGSFPMKFFEYLASGKPVVATPLPTLQEFASSCRLADGIEAFSAAMRRAVVEDLDESKVSARVQLALNHSWDERMAQLSQIIRQGLGQRHALERSA